MNPKVESLNLKCIFLWVSTWLPMFKLLSLIVGLNTIPHLKHHLTLPAWHYNLIGKIIAFFENKNHLKDNVFFTIWQPEYSKSAPMYTFPASSFTIPLVVTFWKDLSSVKQQPVKEDFTLFFYETGWLEYIMITIFTHQAFSLICSARLNAFICVLIYFDISDRPTTL